MLINLIEESLRSKPGNLDEILGATGQHDGWAPNGRVTALAREWGERGACIRAVGARSADKDGGEVGRWGCGREWGRLGLMSRMSRMGRRRRRLQTPGGWFLAMKARFGVSRTGDGEPTGGRATAADWERSPSAIGACLKIGSIRGARGTPGAPARESIHAATLKGLTGSG